MATERDAQHPFGAVIQVDTADEEYQHPLLGAVVDADIEAAAGGSAPLVLYTSPGLSVTNP